MNKIFYLIQVFLACVLIYLGVKSGRFPIRTVGETRILYAFLIGLLGELYKEKKISLFTRLIMVAFVFISLLFPENFDKQLPPSLQSYWFVPHVVTYIIAYALLGIVSIHSFIQLYFSKRWDFVFPVEKTFLFGFFFLTCGMSLGALWAKQAWGSFWSFDPKETWALISWLVYLVSVHFSFNKMKKIKLYFWSYGYFVLLFCWMGMKFLPNSIHNY